VLLSDSIKVQGVDTFLFLQQRFNPGEGGKGNLFYGCITLIQAMRMRFSPVESLLQCAAL
jgi:hypothetical protein